MFSNQDSSEDTRDYDVLNDNSVKSFTGELNDPYFDQLDQEYDNLKTSEIIAPHISDGHSISSSPRRQNFERHLDSVLNESSVSSSEGTYGKQHKVTDNKEFEEYITSERFEGIEIPYYDESTVNLRDLYVHKFRGSLRLSKVKEYLLSLLPILGWIHHYNFTWFYNDLVAGITVGCVLVPQSMSYAQIATLPAQYGLYSSFIGAFIYSFFATSKDVCIGPVAVMSLQTAKVVEKVLAEVGSSNSEVTGPIIATILSLLCGVVALAIGVLRLGFLVEFISLNAVAGFMTGSAFSILTGQVPALMGYSSKVNTRTSTYEVVINTLKHLPDTRLDAVFGLIPLFILYLWKYLCGNIGPKLVDRYVSRKNPKRAKAYKLVLFYAQALRNAVIIIIFTLISWGISRNKETAPIKLLGTVPSGLQDVGVMKMPPGLASKVATELPASIIVLVLEHIAIAKAFGRVNGYKIVPDQELVAIGVTNLIGTFFNAYPATGSFSRSALKAKCNVKTPLSGWFTGACVLLALYCLTSAFYYIPKATLSAIIIHAVSDLVASYKTSWNFWLMNPLDFVCFIVTVVITVFSSIENGIYFAICWSCAMLLLKVVFPNGQFLGYVEVCEVVNGEVNTDIDHISRINSTSKVLQGKKQQLSLSNGSTPSALKLQYHTKWLPLDTGYQREVNPDVVINHPPPGIIVYRPSESWTYLNCSRQYDAIINRVKKLTRPGIINRHKSKHEKAWNDPGEWEPPMIIKKVFRLKSKQHDPESVRELDSKPVLRIIALDFSQVTQIDSTGIQSLVDLREVINKYANRQVEFHFSGIISPWIKRGLINAGFGTINEEFSDESIIRGHTSYHLIKTSDEESIEGISTSTETVRTALGINLPFFHLEMPDFHKWSN